MTMQTASTLDRPPSSERGPAGGAVFPGVLLSEWTKLRSVRSTYWTLFAASAGMIAFSAIICAVFAGKYPTMNAKDRVEFDPTSISLAGVSLAQLAIGVLGVLIITSEYAGGAIRSTLVAVPQRRTVLAAKAAVFAVVTLVVSLIACLVSFFLGQALLSGRGIDAHLGDPGVLRVVVGAALYLGLVGLFALGIGTLVRHSAGAISALFGVLLVLPGLVLLLPSAWSHAAAKYLPSNAGSAMAQSDASRAVDDGSQLAPWTGLGVFALYVAITLVCAAVAFDRRDA